MDGDTHQILLHWAHVMTSLTVTPPVIHILDMPHSHNDIKHMPQSHNSNSHSVKLISKSLPANQLCNIICHKLHIHRDTSIQDTIILRQQLRKEKLALARIKRAETY